MKQIPIGYDDFKEVREYDLYYVDKSPLIDRVIRGSKVQLYTRPRRFGKSLNISMLDAYLDLRHRGNTWFDGLAISEIRPDDPQKNAYPVIHFDMKGMASDSYEGVLGRTRVAVSELCKTYPRLADSDRQDPDDVEIFRSLKSQTSTDSNLAWSLRTISRMLEREHGRKTVILIDEYDNALNQAYGCGDQRRILGFVRELLSAALKGNGSLRLGVVTGVMQIAKESIFSGFNNFDADNILSRNTDELFGFTPEEVRRMCADFGRPDRFAEAEDWYDGYRFGDADIYNPWSILNYVNRGFVPDTYWAGTSGNSIIDDLLSVLDQETYSDIMTLGAGGSVKGAISPGVTYADISERGSGMYGVMAMSGYLSATCNGGDCDLRIPNREMFKVFADTILANLTAETGARIRAFARALLSGDTAEVSESLEDLFMSVLSSRVLDDEHPYQSYIAGLLMCLFGNYRITADLETGKGYHDIRMERLRGNGPNVVIEVKRSGSDDQSACRMEGLCREALQQIHDRRYYHGLEGRTLLYGIAFSGKTPTVVMEEIALGGKGN